MNIKHKIINLLNQKGFKVKAITYKKTRFVGEIDEEIDGGWNIELIGSPITDIGIEVVQHYNDYDLNQLHAFIDIDYSSIRANNFQNVKKIIELLPNRRNKNAKNN